MTRDRRLRIATYRVSTALADRADALEHLAALCAVVWVIAGSVGCAAWAARSTPPGSVVWAGLLVALGLGVPSVAIGLAMLPRAVRDVVRASREVREAREARERLARVQRTERREP